jgi:hypothetical protein
MKAFKPTQCLRTESQISRYVDDAEKVDTSEQYACLSPAHTSEVTAVRRAGKLFRLSLRTRILRTYREGTS